MGLSEKEAFVKAGFQEPYSSAKVKQLLKRRDITAAISSFSAAHKTQCDLQAISAGLNRLAFDASPDSIKLLLLEKEELLSQMEFLDLFHVSEIKVPRDGAIEVKFFDRFKAIDMLLSLLNRQQADQESRSYFTALESAATLLKESHSNEA